MKKLFILVAAFCMMSCTTDYLEDVIEEVQVEAKQQSVSEDYLIMYQFVDDLVFSELFGLTMPENPSYDELMNISASVIMTDTFADTIGEGDCEKVYRLMFAYFQEHDPNAKVTSYLEYLLINGLY